MAQRWLAWRGTKSTSSKCRARKQAGDRRESQLAYQLSRHDGHGAARDADELVFLGGDADVPDHDLPAPVQRRADGGDEPSVLAADVVGVDLQPDRELALPVYEVVGSETGDRLRQDDRGSAGQNAEGLLGDTVSFSPTALPWPGLGLDFIRIVLPRLP